MKLFSRVRLFVTPWTLAHQAPLSMGFSMQVYWSGLPFPTPGDLPNPGMELAYPASLLHCRQILYCWAPGDSPYNTEYYISIIIVQLPSCVQLLATSWTVACQTSLSCTIFQSLPKFMSIESLMPSRHLILCHPLLLLPSVFPSIRVFSNELAVHIRWPKYWSFSFSISPSSEYSGMFSFKIDWFDLLAVQGTLKNLLQYHSLKASICRHSALVIKCCIIS